MSFVFPFLFSCLLGVTFLGRLWEESGSGSGVSHLAVPVCSLPARPTRAAPCQHGGDHSSRAAVWAAGALGALCDADAATRGTHSCRDAACTDSSAPLCPSPCAHTMVHPRGAEHPIFLCFCRCSVAAMSPILHRAHPPAHTGPCSLLHHCLPDGVPLQELRCSAGPGKQQHRMAHSAHRETPRPGDGGTDRPGQLSVSIQDRQ